MKENVAKSEIINYLKFLFLAHFYSGKKNIQNVIYEILIAKNSIPWMNKDLTGSTVSSHLFYANEIR